MDIFHIKEPYLFFKDGKKCIDPKVGLLNFGPSGLNKDNTEINVGLVGTRLSILHTRQFLNRLKYDIKGQKKPNSNVWGLDFPGVEINTPLGFSFNISDEYCEIISEESLNSIINKSTRQKKVNAAAEIYRQALEDLSGVYPGPDLVIIPLPQKLIKACVDPSLKTNNIKLYSRDFNTLQRITKMPISKRPKLFDFHHYLKVIGFEFNLKTQIIKPRTLQFESSLQDPATIAWNFVVANFYKSTGIPWKLADLEPETIHVGVSFYNDIGNENTPIIRAAIAQIYMKTGDSQIIRGVKIPVNLEDTRNVNLTENQAFDILDNAISLYRRQHNNIEPIRIVVHKRSNYSNSELKGFHNAAEGISIQDYIHIMTNPLLRVISQDIYPIARGSVFHTNKNEFYIFTTGYIPALDTYPGSEIPKPLRIKIADANSPVGIIALDIMNLTKLDWNSASFAKSLPVTISVSQKVSEIMGEITISNRNITLPTAYANYM